MMRRSGTMRGITRRELLRWVGVGVVGHALLGNALIGCASKPADAAKYAAVEELVDKLRNTFDLPGVAVGLIRDNELVYARGFGVRNLDTGEPMTETSVMAMASMSKTLTGAAIYQLVEAGKISLGDPYVKHVPYFQMEDERYKEITIRHILAHTSGLPMLDMGGADFYAEWDDPWTDDGAAERLVRSLAKGVRLSQAPGGASFLYSDVGYDILAALIHQVTGELFEDYQQRHILKPLQMKNSTFLMSEVKPQDLAAAHVSSSAKAAVWDRYPYTRQHAPSGCLFTNVVDLSHWVMANLNQGTYRKRIMKPETHAQTWESLYDRPWDWSDGYNSGWFVGTEEKAGMGPVRLVFTGGAMPGVSTYAMLFPDQGLASIALVNLCEQGSNGYSGSICEALAAKLLRGEL